MDSVNTLPTLPAIASAEGLSKRALLVRKAAARLPTTAEDLPVGFYRVDLLPADEFVEQGDVNVTSNLSENREEEPADTEQGVTNDRGAVGVRQQIAETQALSAAYVELGYEHGYPTLPSGEPFWHKLDYEPGLAYGIFQIYLDQDSDDSEGSRELTQLANNEEFLRVLQAHQSRDTPISQTEALRTLQEFYILYFWKARSKAYDLYQEAAYRHKRIKRAMSAEDHHYRLSAKALKVIETYLESKDFEDGLTPKTAMDALSKLVGIQRVSAGLPAAGPLPAKDAPNATQFEAILRQIGTQAANNGADASQNTQSRVKNDVLDKMLKDPETTKTMQELIIRVTTTSHNPQEVKQARGRVYDSEAAEIDATLAEDIKFHQI